MYIGPWQEYKLAKILEMKAKLEKEQLAEPETAPTSSKNIVASQQRRLPPLSNTQEPSVRSMGAQRQNSNSLRRTTKRSTNSIDQHYKKWRRFDHALEYGQKLELKERLKEFKDFDPPNLNSYFPNEVMRTMRPTRPPLPKPVNAELKKEQAREEQLRRMDKMREMYGIKKSQSKEEIAPRAPRGRQVERKQKKSPPQEQYQQEAKEEELEERKDTSSNLPKIKEKAKDLKSGLYSYYYQKYMASEIQKHQLKLPESPLKQKKILDLSESQYEKSGNLQEIDKIVKWAQRLPDDVK